ncbi:hypothetical protein EVAR_23120_1 [Eumeta japonica]|uniref:Uncharacterized protein n=1 Tax=Eumeta variegata TaxID=151549 RepID=A0A4C1VAM5_EUMVA|nr:hypothetical protein EVAR_23120_1 [Eumeta japonica]
MFLVGFQKEYFESAGNSGYVAVSKMPRGVAPLCTASRRCHCALCVRPNLRTLTCGRLRLRVNSLKAKTSLRRGVTVYNGLATAVPDTNDAVRTLFYTRRGGPARGSRGSRKKGTGKPFPELWYFGRAREVHHAQRLFGSRAAARSWTVIMQHASDL